MLCAYKANQVGPDKALRRNSDPSAARGGASTPLGSTADLEGLVRGKIEAVVEWACHNRNLKRRPERHWYDRRKARMARTSIAASRGFLPLNQRAET